MRLYQKQILLVLLVWAVVVISAITYVAAQLPPPLPLVAPVKTNVVVKSRIVMSPKLAAQRASLVMVTSSIPLSVYSPHLVTWNVVPASQVTNQPVPSVVLSGSTDFTNWQTLAVFPDVIGAYSYLDTNQSPSRFYRVFAIGSYDFIDTLIATNYETTQAILPRSP